MEAVEKQPDQLNMFALVVITLVGALIVYGSFVGLQAYFEYSLSSLQDDRRAASMMDDELAVTGVDFTIANLAAEHQQVLSGYAWVNDAKSAVTLPIDVAMAKVVESVKGAPQATLVPSVGAHDTPTVPAVAGRPPDNVQMPVPTAPASASGDAVDSGDAMDSAAAGDDAAGSSAAADDTAVNDAVGDTAADGNAAGTESATPASNPAQTTDAQATPPAAANPASGNPPSAPATETTGENEPQ